LVHFPNSSSWLVLLTNEVQRVVKSRVVKDAAAATSSASLLWLIKKAGKQELVTAKV
jgi:hypothetical protein